jgi:hypothetical protein
MQGGIEMRRRTFDALATMAGLVLAVVLAIGGGLLLWGHSVISNDVHTQLAAQKIVFPPANSAPITELPAADAAAMNAYGGQLMTTGAQAQTYADHFIAVHLDKIGGGKTYSQLSAQSLANPSNAALKAQVDTLFKGETLHGLLLNAYAFWQIGQIALIVGIVALAAAAVMLVLSGFAICADSRERRRRAGSARAWQDLAGQAGRSHCSRFGRSLIRSLIRLSSQTAADPRQLPPSQVTDGPGQSRTPGRTLGKRVGGNPSRVRISHPPLL